MYNTFPSLKYLRSSTLDCKDIGVRKSEFVTRTQFLCVVFVWCLDGGQLYWMVRNEGFWPK